MPLCVFCIICWPRIVECVGVFWGYLPLLWPDLLLYSFLEMVLDPSTADKLPTILLFIGVLKEMACFSFLENASLVFCGELRWLGREC